MKSSKNIFLVFLFGSISLMFAQNPIPNPGFENWAGINPDSWSSTNLQGQVTNVTQTSDAHSGSWAAKGEVMELFGFPYGPGLMTGFTGPCCLPFPISENYDRMTGYYKCQVLGADLGIGVIVNFLDANMQHVALGTNWFGESSSYDQFEVIMDYSGGNGNPAAFAQIEFSIYSNAPDTLTNGSWWIVDDLEFAGVAGVEKVEGITPDGFDLKQNYPNPFNPSTNINFSITEEAFVTLIVYNVSGEEVATLANQNLVAGTYIVDWNVFDLPSGVYVYALRAGDVLLTKKMQLLK